MKRKTEIMFCQALMDLLKKHPFHKITIQMIASKCGLNRQTFYYHYDNVYDLMESAFEWQFIKESHFSDNMGWEKSLQLFLSWMKKNRLIVRNLTANVSHFDLRDAIYPIVLKCMTNDYQPNIIIKNDENNPEEAFVHRFLTIGITQYIMEWVESDYKLPEETISQNIFLILKRMYR